MAARCARTRTYAAIYSTRRASRSFRSRRSARAARRGGAACRAARARWKTSHQRCPGSARRYSTWCEYLPWSEREVGGIGGTAGLHGLLAAPVALRPTGSRRSPLRSQFLEVLLAPLEVPTRRTRVLELAK